MSAMSDYLENKLIDQVFRGQAYSAPATLYVGLLTSAPSDAGDGAEPAGGNYARAAIASSLVNWSGTQAAGSTAASSGTGGQTSNNVPITFQVPAAGWGTVTHFGVYDSASGGNLLFYGELAIPKTINNGDSISFPAASLAFTFA